MEGEISTVSGKSLQILSPDLELICIEDVAVHLSRIPRFGGATSYTVGDHSVYVSILVEQLTGSGNAAAEGLMHDASEAYLGDMLSPLKQLLPDFKAIERLWEGAIRKRFTLTDKYHAEVKHADAIALRAEIRDLDLSPTCRWPKNANADAAGWPTIYQSRSAREAECRFLSRAIILGIV